MTSEKTQMLMADLARRGKKGLEFAKQTMQGKNGLSRTP